MHLLITRPQPDAEALAAELAARGHRASIAPLLATAPRADATIPQKPWQAVLVTSANAVRAAEALGLIGSLRAWPVLAVGEASAQAARAAGFGEVTEAGGDLESLAGLASRRFAPGAGPLLYLSGVAVSGDLKGRLEAGGFAVERVVLYEAAAAAALPEAAAEALKEGDLDGVLLYSPRSARIWCALVADAGLDRAAAGLVHFCLSQAVAEALAPLDLDPSRIAVAARPRQEALLALLEADSGSS